MCMRNKKTNAPKKTNNTSIKKNIYVVIVIILIIIVSVFIVWYKKEKDVKVVEANKGNFQIYTETKAYVLNKETVVEYNKDETLVPIAESEKRITIGNVIGIYKNAEYDKGIVQLAKMDEEINEKLALLPEIYSNEVITIDKEIDQTTKEIKNLNSYIQMSDYKAKLDRLAYEKALTISGLTPSGNDVKSLIISRDNYRNNMNKSSNNVKAPISGVIIYKTDSLENKFDLKDIHKLPEKAIQQVINEYDKTHEESFGIKIVDNYQSYIVIKEDKSNDQYIKENRTYTIELLDKNSKIKGILINKVQTDKYNYCIFEINNNVEEIVDLRKVDVKVIWREINGFVVNNSSIKTVEDIDYVTIISLNKYLDIPVKTLLKLENISLVANFSDEEKSNLNLPKVGKLEIYDRIVEVKELE